MQRRAFGWTGELVPVIGQGTWQMESDDRQAAIAALRRGLDLGMTHVDTAELYGSGAVEELVREAIAGRRDEVFLVSKVMPSNATYQGTLDACARSLQRLGTDRLDVYLLHWPGNHPLEGTLRAFEELVAAGKIRHFGVSNFDAEELKEAIAMAGPARIACNQVLYHLGERTIEHRVLPACDENDVPVVGYSPFGSGAFPSMRSAQGKALAAIGEELGVTARQLALAYLVRRPLLFTIPKSSSVAHVEDNAKSIEIALSDDVVEAIEKAFPRGRDRAGIPTI